ncbi:unnamed protein product, partial [Nesidiocoris tenuis]
MDATRSNACCTDPVVWPSEHLSLTESRHRRGKGRGRYERKALPEDNVIGKEPTTPREK